MDQFIAAGWNLAYVITCILHGLQHGNGAGGRIIAHAIGDAAILVRIIGEDDRHLAVDRFTVAQRNPIRGEVRHKFHAVGHGLVGHDAALGGLMVKTVALEGNGAGMDAAVKLRQHNIHGEVACSQALRTFAPTLFRDRAEGNLKYRAIILRQRITTAARSCGKRRSVQQQAG